MGSTYVKLKIHDQLPYPFFIEESLRLNFLACFVGIRRRDDEGEAEGEDEEAQASK